MSSRLIRGFSIILVFLLSTGGAYAAVGTVQFTAGDVTIRDAAGKLREAKKGDPINEGDTILTGNQASAQLKMSDGGILAVRPQTELRFDRYKFSGKEDGTENALMSLLKGGFRTITGIIGRTNKNNYKISTLTATIGIRGTDHEPFFISPVAAGAPQPATPPGTYNKVNVGVAFIATPLGTINIAQNQVGFAAPNQPPQLLPVMPEFFKATPPIRQAQQQKEAEKEKQATGGQSQESQGTPAAEKTADKPAAANAAEPSEVRSTAIVDNTSSPAARSTTTTTTDTSSSTPAITQTVSGTSSSSLDVDLTNQTISTSTDATVPISQGATATATQAQSAADEAQIDANLAVGAHTQTLSSASQTNTTVSSVGAIPQVSTAPATSAISTANTNTSSAQTSVTSAAALTTVDLTATTAAVNSATTAFNTQQTAFSALGTAVDTMPASSTIATANTAITAANSAVVALSASPVNLANANTAVTNANSAIGTAQTAVGNINALAAPDTALAVANAGLSTTVRTTAGVQAAQAAAAIAANGAFADLFYAVPANTATQNALVTVQSKDTLVQTAAGDAATQTETLNKAKTDATNQLGLANTTIGLASATLGTATTENTNFSNARTAATTVLSSANTNITSANTALTNANNFNTTFNNDKTAAQNSLNAASGQIATAGSELTGAQTANAALVAAIAAAQLALNDANTALVAANSQLTTANSNNTAIATAQSAVSGLSSQATAAVSAALNAANLALVAATAAQAAATDALARQNAGDLAGAQAALNTALARLGDAQTQLTAAQAAQGQAQTAANTANTQLTTAQSAVTAASNAVSAAVTAATNASGRAAAAVTQSTTASTQRAAATTAAGNATTAAGSAQTNTVSAQGNIGTAGTAKTSAQSSVTTATSAASTAQGAAGTAQTQAGVANTAFTAASTAATSAESQAATAKTQAGVAQTAAGTASTAQGAAVAAVSTTTTELGNAQAAANTVAVNFQQAQYNNPAVASSNFSHVVSSQAPVTGTGHGTIQSYISAFGPKPNTNYVLDGSRDLVEIRSTTFEGPGPTDNINDVNARFSGGIARDHFQAPDNTVYLGRIQGGRIDVTDNATINPVVPSSFTRQLDPTSAHWLIQLEPGNSAFSTSLGPINNVQMLVGTANYWLTAATRPTDSFGNVGTLNSASLIANFSSQTVNTELGLSFSTTVPIVLVPLASPVIASSRNLNLTASALNVPIVREGGPFHALFFEAGSGSRFPLSITCTNTGPGTDCALGGYVGKIGGAFGGTATGTVGTGVGLSYGFMPAPGANTNNGPDADFIHGVAVLNTTTAPLSGVIHNFPANTLVRHEARYSTSAVGSTDTFIAVARDTINITQPTSTTLSGPRVNTNYLFDASSNLVRIFDTPYVIFDRATNVAPTTTQFSVPTPIAHAQLSFGGGGSAPFDLFNFTPSDGTLPIIRMGRWQGGFVHVMDLQGFMVPGFIDSLVSPIGGGPRSVHWLVRQGVPIIPTTGAFHYVRIPDGSGNPSFATSPTDSYGNVGTLERARLTADFTRMTVSAGLTVTMPSGAGGSLGIQNLSGNFADAPLQSGGFSVFSNPANNPPNTDRFNVSCFGPGCAPNQTYGGSIHGAFAGLNAEGAFYRYTFNTNYGPSNLAPAGRVNYDYIDGLVAFRQGPAIVTPPLTHPEGPSEVLTAYSFFDGLSNQSRTASFSVENPANLTLDGSGNLLSVFKPGHPGDGHNDSLTLTGGTASLESPISGGNGITLGWRSPSPPLTVSGEDFNGCFGTTVCTTTPARTVLGEGLAWVRGPGVFPWYLPGAIATISDSGGAVVSGTASFALTNSIVRDQNGGGATGTVTAGLLADFNRAAVGFDMTIPTAAGTWAAFNNGTTHNGTIVANVKMDGSGGFNAFTGTETTTPAGINTHRQMTVQLSNDGACLTTPCPGFGNVQGQFMGPGVNGAGMTYTFGIGDMFRDRVIGALAFNNPTPFSAETPYHLVLAATGMNPLGNFENTPINGGFVSPLRTQFVDGQPVRVDLEFPVAVIPTGCTTCTTNVNYIPAVFAVTGATGVASIGNAQIFNSGIDPTTGIRWGRYGGPGSAAGDFIGVTDRISGTPLPSIDVGPNTQGVHFIGTGVQSGPTVLPISGIFNYTRVGNTNPTDNFGNVGVLNSAALSADFTNQRVSASVNLTIPVVGGAIWTASTPALNGTATGGVPIQVGTHFGAATGLDGTGNLTVTRAGSDTSTAGRLVGAFTGPTGGGAGVIYSLNQGGNTATNASATTVSGVVGFKR